jgi:peptidyl-Lys metalloendopeptidase
MTKTMTRKCVLAAAGLLLATAGAASAQEGLKVRLGAAKSFIAANEDVAVRFELKNESGRDLEVVYWQTALRGVYNDLFDVRRDGEPVEYIGRDYKWATPQAQDFVLVRAGETLGADVDLASYYDLSQSGEYTVRFRASLAGALRGERDFAQPALRSNRVTLGVERDPELEAALAPIESDALAYLTPGFVSCSSSRQTTLRSALGAAETMALKGRNYLNAGTVDSGYTQWFGTYTSSRYTTVKSHFASIYTVTNARTVTFYCDCTDSAYAYVFKTQPYKIHLCNAFWSAPLTGTDSKGGTLVHEISHFNAVASTDDWAYGQTACRSLATSNPSRATDNADSHEYFAEGRP